MEVESRCALRVGSLLWQPRPGRWALTVVCKATYRLTAPEARLVDAPLPEPIHEEDEYWEDDSSRSLRSVSDLVPFKERCDVLLTGLAYPPPGPPVRSFLVRLKVAGVDKRIEVFGRRRVLASGQVEEGSAERVLLAYESAAGGTANPVGRSREDRDREGRVRLPRLIRPGDDDQAFGAPTGFGPISPTWPSRARLAPPEVTRWTTTQWRGAAIPDGVQPLFFNAAPDDQQVDTIFPDDVIALQHLHPTEPTILSRLPGIFPVARVELAGEAHHLPMKADTLSIDSERGMCTLTWRGQEQLDGPRAAGRIVITQDRVAPRSLREIAVANRSRRTRVVPKTEPPPATGTPAEWLSSDALLTIPPFPIHGAAQTLALPISPAPASPHPPPPPRPSSPGSIAGPPQAAAPGAPGRAADSAASALATQLLLPGNLPAQAWPFFEPPPSPGPPPAPPIAPSLPAPASVDPPPPARVDRPAAPAGLPVGTVGERMKQGLLPAPVEAPPLELPRAESAERAASSREADGAPRVGSLDGLKKVRPLSAQKVSDDAAKQAGPPPAAEPPQVALARAVIVDLLWFDPTFLDVVRRQPDWKDIVRTLKPKPRDADFGEGAPSPKRQEAKDRREVTGVLARGKPEPPYGLPAALRRGIDEDGSFTPPLVLLEGTLILLFDEIEALKTMLDAASPYVVTDDHRLKQAIDAAQEAIRSPWIQKAGLFAERLRKEIEDSFASGKRPISVKELRASVHRLLLEARHYQKTSPLGQPWIRAAWKPSGEPLVTAYLPMGPARELPLFESFPARIIAEVRPRMELSEAADLALRVVALGRTLSFT